MNVKITLTGPMACGKTHLAGYLREAVERQARETGQKIELEIVERIGPAGSRIDTNRELYRNWPTNEGPLK